MLGRQSNNQPRESDADSLHRAMSPLSQAGAPVPNSPPSLILLPSDSKHAPDLHPSNPPIFSEDWWIAIARGSSYYRELKIVDGNEVLGKLPFILSRNKCFILAQDPYWSHLGGPILDARLNRKDQAEVVHQLLAQFPRWCSGYFVCNPNNSYADLVRDAFQRAGFEHTAQTTYVRYPTDVPVTHIRKAKHNGHIKRASQKLDCVAISATEFVRFYESNLNAKQKTSYAPLEIVARLTDEAVRRGQARAIAARPKDSAETASAGAPLYDAAIVYVWDRSHCYYWMSTYRPHSPDNRNPKPHPDAIKVLAMHAMQHAQDMKIIFDADGVTTPGSDHLYRNMFGLRKEVRRDVFQRTTSLERLVRKVGQSSRRWLALCAPSPTLRPKRL
jgi:hypothetical protein